MTLPRTKEKVIGNVCCEIFLFLSSFSLSIAFIQCLPQINNSLTVLFIFNYTSSFIVCYFTGEEFKVGWKYVWAVKDTCHSCRRPGLGSCHPHGGSRTCIRAIADLTSSSGLYQHQAPTHCTDEHVGKALIYI